MSKINLKKMNYRIKQTIIGILSLIILTSGSIYVFRNTLITHFIPSVKQIGDINIEIKKDTANIRSQLQIKNKSFFKITIDSIRYEASLFNKTYLKNQKLIGLTLLNHEMDTLDFSLKIPYINLIKDLKTERNKSDSASYSIDISLIYSSIFGKIIVPIQKAEKIKIPIPPEIKIMEIKYNRIRLKHIQAEAKLQITNHSAVALKIKDLEYSMNIINHGIVKGKLTEPIRIHPNGTSFISLPIEINVNNLGRTILEVMWNKDNYDYTLNIIANLGSYHQSQGTYNINISNSGKMELKK